jgi:hypothetical protein
LLLTALIPSLSRPAATAVRRIATLMTDPCQRRPPTCGSQSVNLPTLAGSLYALAPDIRVMFHASG